MKLFFHAILYTLLICLFFAGFVTPNTALTQDLGRHLLLGNMILTNASVPKVNLFSYTYPDFPFVNHHYLSEIVFASISSFFGIQSLIYVSIFCMLIACLLIFLVARNQSSFLSLVVASLFGLRILFERVDVRPEVFSFLLAAIFVTLLYRNREKPSKWIFLLIPLTFLWIQLHIYFFVGILLIFLFLVDGVIKNKFRLNKYYLKLLTLTLLGSLLFTAVNPNGIEGALYPLRVFDNYGYTIEENQSVFLLQSIGFVKPSIPYFQMSALLLFISLFLSIKKSRPIDWLLAIVFAISGFMAVRNLPLFAIICFISFARSLSNVQKAYISPFFNRHTSKRNLIYAVTYFLLCLVLIWQINDVAKLRGFGFTTKDPYKNAVVFFKSHNLVGPIFNNFDVGSYIVYSLYPQERVFVDGRPEAYPKNFLQNVYIPIQEDQAIFNQAAKKYNFNTIFISHTDQTPWAENFLINILENPEWSPVYLDDSILILVKKTEKNQPLINSFGMEKDTLVFSQNSPKDLQSLLQKARFANLIQSAKLEKQTYEEILSANPEFCPALQNLAILLSNENDPTATIYINRYQALCA